MNRWSSRRHPVSANPLVPRRWLFAKTALPFIIYNKVKVFLCIDLNQERIKKCMKKVIFYRKSFGGSEKSRTFAPANQEHLLTSEIGKSSLKDLHRQK